jgi:hypothetical protein
MTLFREPSDWQPPERDRAAGAGTHYRTVRGAAKRIGRGSLACPACDLPILVASSIPMSAPIECPFCRHACPARQFLRLETRDTSRNNVELIARLPG